MKPPCWPDTHLIRSNMASTELTSGLLPVLSISFTFWVTPGLMLTTSTIPMTKDSTHRALRTSSGTWHPSWIHFRNNRPGGTGQYWDGDPEVQPKRQASVGTSADAFITFPTKWSRKNSSCVFLKNEGAAFHNCFWKHLLMRILFFLFFSLWDQPRQGLGWE